MNDSLDFFKMRRCVDDLHPDPAFPGCIYSEMKMCLAPCFKGCSDEESRRSASVRPPILPLKRLRRSMCGWRN
jgi:excinuclease ABC subunit C